MPSPATPNGYRAQLPGHQKSPSLSDRESRIPLTPSTSRSNLRLNTGATTTSVQGQGQGQGSRATPSTGANVSQLRQQFSRASMISPPSPSSKAMGSGFSKPPLAPSALPKTLPRPASRMLTPDPSSNGSAASSPPRSESRSSSVMKPDSSNKGENVTVCVRLRPPLQSEDAVVSVPTLNGAAGSLEAQSNSLANLGKLVNGSWEIDTLTNSISSADESKRIHEFQFDAVMTGSDNAMLYSNCIAKQVKSCMEGYPATVFAYGQTNSGKTFSMMGTDAQPGVIPRAVEDVFSYIRDNSDQEFLLRVSYLEIYNETLRDLLSPENSELRIHEDKRRGVYVSPLREEIVTSPRQVLRVIQRGEMHRHTSTTDFNEHSSRSHTVFTMIIESRQRTGTPQSTPGRRLSISGTRMVGGSVQMSQLNLIDLAGSEKASSQLERRKEGAYINKSLLTLGNVIARITEDKNTGHIPYRDSKLTRILQSSLSGNAKISVICTISPTQYAYEESVNTLKFAQRVKKVVTRASTHEIMDDKALLQKYRMEIMELKAKLAQTHTNLDPEQKNELQQLKQAKAKHDEEMAEMQLIRTALKERIDHLTRLILTSTSMNANSVEVHLPMSPRQSDGGRLLELERAVSEKDKRIAQLEKTVSEMEIVVSQADETYPDVKELRDALAFEKERRLGEQKQFTHRIQQLEAELDDAKQELLISKMANTTIS